MKLLSVPCIVFMFTVVILTDWYYAYAVLYQPTIILSAWSVVFPFLSVFYLFFSVVALKGLFYKKAWGLQLASFMVLLGSIFSILSYAIAYKYFPIIEILIIFLLMFNFIVLLYLGIYYLSLKK